MAAEDLQHHEIETNGIRLHVVTAGPEDGPMVVLLHGFPELWLGWKKQIPALAARGFRVVVPDQRGYNQSDKPKGVSSYRLDELGKDIAGLIKALGRERAHVVGHDWGGAVAWWVATEHSQLVDRLIVLNVAHPTIMMSHILSSAAQAKKSWYIFLFQLPIIPERRLLAGDGVRFAKSLAKTSTPGAFSEEDLLAYRKAWKEPGAMTAMVNWYRAAMRSYWKIRPKNPRISRPSLLIWGEKDAFSSVEMAEPTIALCEHGRLVKIPDATHWVQHDKPEEVAKLIGDFLSEEAAG